MPEEFHHFLHEVTEWPPVPDEDVMYYRIQAWRTAELLFKKGREVLHWERLRRRRRQRVANNPHIVAEGFDGQDPIGEEYMHSVLEKNFRGVERQLEQNERLPAEFRFFDSGQPLPKILGSLGEIVVPRSVKLAKAVAA